MKTVKHRIVPLAVAALLPLVSIAAPRTAAAFQAGQSPDFAGCNVWFNDQGKPLRNKLGREIGQEVPCPGQAVRHDAYKVFPGAAKNTLVIQDETHQLECVLALAPGSSTVVVPTACRAWGG